MKNRFWSKVSIAGPAECWLWTSTVNNKGYGQMSVQQPDHPSTRKDRPMYAHRIAWQLTHGTIPKGLNVLHRCDVPRCVNPAHLFLGTQRDNAADMMAKKRHPGMPPSPTIKLTPDQVRAIRKDPRTHGVIASDYDLQRLSVWKIKHRLTWRQIPD
jgi:hypothetical protein